MSMISCDLKKILTPILCSKHVTFRVLAYAKLFGDPSAPPL